MECVLQTVLVHALHEVLVILHQPVGVAASDPVEFRVALSQLRELAVKVSVCRNRLHIDMCEVNASRVETDVVEHGMLYIAVPPLYLVKYNKDKKYINTNEELNEFKNTFKGKYTVQRYKGLSEMNADQLWETTMDPSSRTLVKVRIDDKALAEKRVGVLMGDDSEIRKEWIEENVEFTLEDDYTKGAK